MELKVWVEGIQRIVCGVTEKTTCQDVVFALAHATGKIGRFTLIERWRNNERLLAPNENPLKILMKWGEYSSDVQFILQRSDQQKPTTNSDLPSKNPLASSTSSHAIESPKKLKASFEPPKCVEKSSPILQLNNKIVIADQKPDPRKNDLIGIVRGVPHTTMNNLTKISPPLSPSSSSTSTSITTASDFTDTNFLSTPPKSLATDAVSPILEFNSADVRNSLDRKTSAFREVINISNESLKIPYRSNNNTNSTNSSISSTNDNNNFDSTTEIYKNGPPISSNGALAPPPYRNPPPPRTSPPPPPPTATQQKSAYNNLFVHQKSDSQSSTNSANGIDFSNKQKHFMKEISPTTATKPTMNTHQTTNLHINAMGNLQAVVNNATSDSELMNDNHFQNAQYRELLQLIQYQRDKINIQQADITKYDAEIIYLESRERDQIQQLDAITREINKTDHLFRQSSEQLQTLQYVEEENELVRQQEKTLKSEITLLRSKLANCETELLQCKNKIRLLMDDIQIEQCAQQFDGPRQQFELHFLHEVERIQTEIDHAVRSSESSNKISDSLKKEVAFIETAIAEKKKQLEKLVNEMKEVNLQSLTVASTEEIRNLLEGSHRPGSTRRIMGSPRQLETAVPTSKNPHGVWV